MLRDTDWHFVANSLRAIVISLIIIIFGFQIIIKQKEEK